MITKCNGFFFFFFFLLLTSNVFPSIGLFGSAPCNNNFNTFASNPFETAIDIGEIPNEFTYVGSPPVAITHSKILTVECPAAFFILKKKVNLV